MLVALRTRMHAHTHARGHACTHACTGACTHTSMHGGAHAHTHARGHARTHACTGARMLSSNNPKQADSQATAPLSCTSGYYPTAKLLNQLRPTSPPINPPTHPPTSLCVSSSSFPAACFRRFHLQGGHVVQCGAGWRHGAVQGGDMVRCRVATWCGVVTYSSISRLKFMKKLDPVHQQGKGSGLRALAPHPPRAHTHRHTRTHTHTSLHVHTRTGTLPTTEFRPATHYVTVNKWYHVHHTVPCATYGTICTIRYHVHHTVPCAPYGTMCMQ